LFLDRLKAAIDEQQRELERAIVDKGKYKFKKAFKNLAKGENEWFLKMTTLQKQNHIKRIGSVPLQSKKATTKTPSTRNNLEPKLKSLKCRNAALASRHSTWNPVSLLRMDVAMDNSSSVLSRNYYLGKMLRCINPALGDNSFPLPRIRFLKCMGQVRHSSLLLSVSDTRQHWDL
jgi:hypothetical protein